MNHVIRAKKSHFILIVLMFCSCNSALKTVTGLYGKELCAGGGDLCAPNKFYIYKDSTFEYKECGPGIMYSKGYWHFGMNRSNIILQTIDEQDHNKGKAFIDTVFLNLDGTVLKVKNTRTLQMSRYKQLFHVCLQNK